jgi:hypothetical protein
MNHHSHRREVANHADHARVERVEETMEEVHPEDPRMQLLEVDDDIHASRGECTLAVGAVAARRTRVVAIPSQRALRRTDVVERIDVQPHEIDLDTDDHVVLGPLPITRTEFDRRHALLRDRLRGVVRMIARVSVPVVAQVRCILDIGEMVGMDPRIVGIDLLCRRDYSRHSTTGATQTRQSGSHDNAASHAGTRIMR